MITVMVEKPLELGSTYHAACKKDGSLKPTGSEDSASCIKADRVGRLGEDDVSVDHVSDLRGKKEERKGSCSVGDMAGLADFACLAAIIAADGGSAVLRGHNCCLLVREIKGVIVLLVCTARITFRLDDLRVLPTAAFARHGGTLC
jgi:hypothetical protein